MFLDMIPEGFLDPILTCMCVEASPHQQAIPGHQQGVQEFNSVLTLSPQREHQIPHVKGSVLNTVLRFRCQSQAQVVTCASN